VKLAALRRHGYAIALRHPWRDARGSLSTREGWLVCIEDADGLRGWGDAPCLPALGTGMAAGIEAALDWAAEVLPGLDTSSALARLEADGASMPLAAAPAARSALEFALLDLSARRAGVPLYRWLRGEAEPVVAVNASIGGLDGETPGRLASACQAGFAVAKLKLGSRPPEQEWPGLDRLLAGRPAAIALRLDVNGAWPVASAQRWLSRLHGRGVEALEEPAAGAGDATLARWQAGLDFPLALDESLPGRDDALTLPVRRQVLKPTLLGGPRRALALAARPGVGSVVSSALETAVGLWACAHLAAALPAAGSRGLAHGLDTGRWLSTLLGPSLPVGGRILLDDAPGLGFEPEVP
jgi:o-succinylbenzoate synthase